MALNAILFVVMVAAIAMPALGADYVVGDAGSWKLNVNYTTWAQGKEFHAGDRLIFKYTQGPHNVHRLSDAGDFQQCALGETTILTSGNDVITLASLGKKWYACGVSYHCSKGMKVAVNVISDLSPSPAPTSDSAAAGYSAGCMSWCWALAALALHKMAVA